jgi:tetratricopeptide (TPR) repeat protein
MIYRRKGDMGIWPLFNKTGNRDSAFADSTPKGPLPPLEDADYLLLFNQILEGLRLGWERQDVVKYLEGLGDRGNFALWAAWLQRFGETKLKKNSQNMDLGRRLVKLGQLNCGEFSTVAYQLGSQLLSQQVTTSPFSSQPAAATSPVSEGTEEGQQSLTSTPTDGEAEVDRSETETPENLTPENLEMVKSLFEEGNQKFQGGDFAGAIAAYQQSLKLKPDFIEAWSNLGAVLFNLQEYEDALIIFNTAIDLNPDNPNIWFNRGFTLTLLKRPQEANESYEKCLQLKPDFMNAWQNRGVVLSQLERYDEAIYSHEQALKLKPDFAEAWSNRGNALLHLERYSEAIASYDQAIAHQPHYPDAWFNRGICFINEKNYAEAIASLDQVIQQQPNYHPAWVVRGLAFMNCQQPQEAIDCFDRALVLQPNDPDVLGYRQEALQQLEA